MITRRVYCLCGKMDQELLGSGPGANLVFNFICFFFLFFSLAGRLASVHVDPYSGRAVYSCNVAQSDSEKVGHPLVTRP